MTGDRPQDVGRSHKRRAGVAPETAALLERYRDTMRAELTSLLDEIRPAEGQLTIEGKVLPPSLELRRALWDLAIRLGKELGNGIDPEERTPRARPRTPGAGRAPRLSARERKALGAE